jgi:hypothetical protein
MYGRGVSVSSAGGTNAFSIWLPLKQNDHGSGDER